MRRLMIRVGILLACGIGLLLLGGWVGDLWLESAGGRRLLQHELSKAIGSPVHLSGDYRMRLVPRVVIVGEALALGLEVGGAPVTVESFEAAVGLLPLLRSSLRIDSVILTGGRVDVGRLDRLRGNEPAGAPPVSLPAVAEFELRQFRLLLPDREMEVRLDRLELAGFRPDSPTPLAIEAALFDQGEPFLAARLNGSVQLPADASSVRLLLDSLSVRADPNPPFELRGRIEWWGADERVTGELRYEGPADSIMLDVTARVGAGMSGEARAVYEHAAPVRSASAEIRFVREAPDIRLQAITVDIDGQQLAGRGCVRVGDRLTLAASLAAAELDLDRLDGWFAMPDEEGAAREELPFDPAIAIDVAEARMSGSIAHGVRIRVGPEPSCPDPVPAG